MTHTYTDRDYFDQKFQDIEERFTQLYKILNGNGKPGLIQRVDCMETDKTSQSRSIKAFIVSASILFTLVGIYVRQFFEDVYKHIYGR
jgi:hypothetical protein